VSVTDTAGVHCEFTISSYWAHRVSRGKDHPISAALDPTAIASDWAHRSRVMTDQCKVTASQVLEWKRLDCARRFSIAAFCSESLSIVFMHYLVRSENRSVLHLKGLSRENPSPRAASACSGPRCSTAIRPCRATGHDQPSSFISICSKAGQVMTVGILRLHAPLARASYRSSHPDRSR
jgi:hypothetical protein